MTGPRIGDVDGEFPLCGIDGKRELAGLRCVRRAEQPLRPEGRGQRDRSEPLALGGLNGDGPIRICRRSARTRTRSAHSLGGDEFEISRCSDVDHGRRGVDPTSDHRNPGGARLEDVGRTLESGGPEALPDMVNAFIAKFRPATTIVGGRPVYVRS